MKIDVFNHIFPRAYFDRMIEVLPGGKDMHQRAQHALVRGAEIAIQLFRRKLARGVQQQTAGPGGVIQMAAKQFR